MIHTIDVHHAGVPRIIASFVVETQDGPVLIETGPESAYARLAEGLEALGYAPEDVRHVLVTHIHLDHAGAAWRFAHHGARVYVHPRGAKHLVDPSRLLDSARRIYREAMERLWGRVEGIPAEQVRPVESGEVLRIGGVAFQALETPGHAPHHHAYRVEGVAFTGDVGGVRIGNGPVLPPCPPPDIHVEAWRASLDRLRREGLEALYLTHFGRFTDVAAHLDALEARLVHWADWIRARLAQGMEAEAIVPEFEALVRETLEAAGLSPAEVREYELADPAWMSVMGLVRYWRKHRPEALG
ncbi:MBL fold metallo-hydrolase [Marinithermus hydrothermalis]|uniref:Beta-lactamase domain protein n=1 Tax=Marinithermus hydrothermalis (strain DSM 14884 / JCM 11576 / T1) TaxID=869210 RepID=F2NQT8_MARHT|nr:MBL fold metallo-hydrolase [Marinithermus hydrothermalis]AEB12302.1 beta-lactamase domain protein [Marinithermus hydrothermalis DSM 14884]